VCLSGESYPTRYPKSILVKYYKNQNNTGENVINQEIPEKLLWSNFFRRNVTFPENNRRNVGIFKKGTFFEMV